MSYRIGAAIALAMIAASPGRAAERTEIVTNFDRLNVTGPYVVRLVSGRGSSATLSGGRLAIEAVRVRVNGGVLSIGPDRTRATNDVDPVASGPVTIVLTTPSLRAVALSGNGLVEVDRLKGERIEASLQGDGTLTIGTIEAERGVIQSIGAGTLSAAGKAGSLILTVRGSARVDAADLTVGELQLTQQTSGDIAIRVNGRARGASTGAGETVIAGRTECAVSALGAGAVRCGQQER